MPSTATLQHHAVDIDQLINRLRDHSLVSGDRDGTEQAPY
jgi:hypothetical protein